MILERTFLDWCAYAWYAFYFYFDETLLINNHTIFTIIKQGVPNSSAYKKAWVKGVPSV